MSLRDRSLTIKVTLTVTKYLNSMVLGWNFNISITIGLLKTIWCCLSAVDAREEGWSVRDLSEELNHRKNKYYGSFQPIPYCSMWRVRISKISSGIRLAMLQRKDNGNASFPTELSIYFIRTLWIIFQIIIGVSSLHRFKAERMRELFSLSISALDLGKYWTLIYSAVSFLPITFYGYNISLNPNDWDFPRIKTAPLFWWCKSCRNNDIMSQWYQHLLDFKCHRNH